jgi:hypothetical protein
MPLPTKSYNFNFSMLVPDGAGSRVAETGCVVEATNLFEAERIFRLNHQHVVLIGYPTLVAVLSDDGDYLECGIDSDSAPADLSNGEAVAWMAGYEAAMEAMAKARKAERLKLKQLEQEKAWRESA